MPTTLRKALTQVSEPRPGMARLSIPHDLQSSPRSMLALAKATQDPRVGQWTLSHEGQHEDDWTDGLQGVTTDGKYFYFSQTHTAHLGSSPARRMLWRRDTELNEVASLDLSAHGDHVGDIDYFEGFIYAPMEDSVHPRFLKIDVRGDMKVVDDHTVVIPNHPQTHNPWCAINPWNGLLYSSNFDHVTELYAYDPAKAYQFVKKFELIGADVDGVQGGVFSRNGNLILSSDGYDEMKVFSAIDGAFRGKIPVQKEHPKQVAGVTVDGGQEIEGLCIFPGLIGTNGDRTAVHLILQELHATQSDKLFLKHYSVPDESIL
jgi:hypothetical protein